MATMSTRPFPIMLVKLAYYAHSNAGCFLKIILKLSSFFKIMFIWLKQMLGFNQKKYIQYKGQGTTTCTFRKLKLRANITLTLKC